MDEKPLTSRRLYAECAPGNFMTQSIGGEYHNAKLVTHSPRPSLSRTMAEQTDLATQGKQKRVGNRRAYPRFSAMFEVRYAENKDPMQPGKPMEISEGGLSFETQDLLPLETQVNVEFKLSGAKDWVKVKGVVRHSKDKQLGVEFLN